VRREARGVRRQASGFAIAIVLLLARIAGAHPLDLGYLKIDTHGDDVTVALDLEAGVAARSIGAASPADAVELATDRGACTWGPPHAEIVAATTTVSQSATAHCPAGSHQLHYALPFVATQSPTFQVLAKTKGFVGEHVTMVDRHAPVLDLAGAAETTFGGIVWIGVRHIGAAPSEWHDPDRGLHLPDGIDHIVFLLALLLAGGTILELAGIATGFTIGHSITLALAATGVLRPPPSVLEPLIALTIAAAAVEAFTNRFAKHRWKIAMAFGFIHGFAFASALAELDLSSTGLAKPLFGFNLGVELGQLTLILLLAPGILLLHRYRPRAARIFTKVAAALIFVAGIYWFISRIL
jgi:hypothetical protein